MNVFSVSQCSPASPVGSLASSWPSAAESDGEAAAATPRPSGAFARQFQFSADPASGAAAAWQHNSSVRLRTDHSVAGWAAAEADDGVRQQPAGSPDGAAPMQQDGGGAPTPPNPFERCAADPRLQKQKELAFRYFSCPLSRPAVGRSPRVDLRHVRWGRGVLLKFTLGRCLWRVPSNVIASALLLQGGWSVTGDASQQQAARLGGHQAAAVPHIRRNIIHNDNLL